MIQFESINIKLPSVKKKVIKLDFKVSDNLPKIEKYGIDQSFIDLHTQVANQSTLYEKYKNFVNPYALVNPNFFSLQQIKNLTGLDVKVLAKNHNTFVSRAYYKMWEMLHDYSLISSSKTTPIISANIAEAPGGYVQAIINYRDDVSKNKYIVTSLKEPSKRAPNQGNSTTFEFKQNRVKKFIAKYRDDLKVLTISYGDEVINNGDLNKLRNIKAYSNLFVENKANIVTADGGITDLDNENIGEINTEIKTLQLIYNEMVTMLSVQKEGGNGMIKLFLLNTYASAQILEILCMYYNEVYLVKPVTSKITSTERYVICKGFRGILQKDLDEMYKVTEEWFKIQPLGGFLEVKAFVVNLFSFKVTKGVMDAIKKFNDEYIDINKRLFSHMVEYIEQNKRGRLNKVGFRKIVEEQQSIAIKWFKRYNMDINEDNVIEFSKNNDVNNFGKLFD